MFKPLPNLIIHWINLFTNGLETINALTMAFPSFFFFLGGGGWGIWNASLTYEKNILYKKVHEIGKLHVIHQI